MNFEVPDLRQEPPAWFLPRVRAAEPLHEHPRSLKPQEHPQQSKLLRKLKRRAPLLLRKVKGVHWPRPPTQRTYMRDYMRKRRMTA